MSEDHLSRVGIFGPPVEPSERVDALAALAEIVRVFDAEVAEGRPELLRTYVVRPAIETARIVLANKDPEHD